MKKLILLFLLSTFFSSALFSQKNCDQGFDVRPLWETDEELVGLPSFYERSHPTPKKDIYGVELPEEWILDSALDNAPRIILGMVSYLRLRGVMYQYKDFKLADSISIPSYQRCILVGPPGSGKTTLAYAIAKWVGGDVAYIPAASLLGEYRNQTALNISRKLKELTDHPRQIVIIIDELHKLFEHHTNDRSDDSQTAAAFWLALDEIEKHNPRVIVIGTANNVDKLPPEIKSRFAGKIIPIPVPDKKQKVYAFKKMLRKDKNLVLEESCDKLFLENIVDQMDNCSLRDLQLLVDAAKIIYYAEIFSDCEFEYRMSHLESKPCKSTVLLTKKHFQQALKQFKSESLLTKEFLLDSDKFTKRLQNWGNILSIAINIISLAYLGNNFILEPARQLFGMRGIANHA